MTIRLATTTTTIKTEQIETKHYHGNKEFEIILKKARLYSFGKGGSLYGRVCLEE